MTSPRETRIIMRPRTLFWKLFAGNAVLIALILGICAWLTVRHVQEFHAKVLTDYLRGRASLIAAVARSRFDAAHQEELDRLVKDMGAALESETRITLILSDGTVLADSEANPREMESHARRREVRQALSEGSGEDTHYSRTLSREMKYAAVRVGPAESPVGVVRVAMAVRAIGEQGETIRSLIWMTTAVGLTAAVLFAIGLARLWSRPIGQITAVARSLSRGDLTARARFSGGDELAMLARSLNEMRDHLANQLKTIDRQRRTVESLLVQVHEGVVVAGPDGRIILMNPEAERMLGILRDATWGAGSPVGMLVEQCITQYELQQMLLPRSGGDDRHGSEDAHATEPEVREVRIQLDDSRRELCLLARASDIVLPDVEERHPSSEGREHRFTGRMLVLTDVTTLTQAVRMKTDFASNASHELRTPLSTIRAAVETLMNLNMADDPQSARHFLGVIDRQTNRMEQMVSDLLDLSRIESAPARFKPHAINLHQLLADLQSRYQERVDGRQLKWCTEVPPELSRIQASPYLLRIVLDNLVDNAIKFTEAGGLITVSCRRVMENGEAVAAVAITVADTGCGIPPEEQDRVFERFYQVGKARSGPDRGTGLGLSIVRHAVAAMKGTVQLESRVGEGTRVTIRIPQVS